MRRGAATLVAIVLFAGCTEREPPADPSESSASEAGDASTVAIPTTGAATTGTTTTATTGTTTTATTGGTAGETFCPCTCGEASVEVPMPRVDLVIVLGKGATMAADPAGLWDHDGDLGTPVVTHWESAHRAVEAMVTRFDAALWTGLSLFPSRTASNGLTPASACPVDDPIEVAVGPMHAAEIVAALPPAIGGQIAGGTPAAAAVTAAISALAEPGHPRHIVYIADAAANCDGDTSEAFETYAESLHDHVVAAFTEVGIVTHVVGIAIADETSPDVADGQPDGVNNHERLDELAVQGGAAVKFHDAQDEAQLAAALDEVVRGALSCTVNLGLPPQFPELVEVRVGGVDYGTAAVTDCATEDGWRYVEPGVTIALCGAACRDFQELGMLTAQYRCGADCCA